MPLLLQENIENGKIGLWKISEEIEELLCLAKLSYPDNIIFSEISASHRKREWLATRALLNELISEPHHIRYHSDGRPYLENLPINISISHSFGFVAILLHTFAIPGIDIELTSRLVGKVASRFLSPDELAACSDKTGFSNNQMLLHWCAKEAIFKMVPLSDIEFSTDIQILMNDLTGESGSFQGIFRYKSAKIPITLYYRLVAEIIIVWGWVDAINFKS
jgi:4'-phosphopantetheinyl transferase